MMKRVICFLIVTIMLLSTTAFGATYYDINVEGLTASEKNEVVEWLKKAGFEYDIESYSSSNNNQSKKAIIVEGLSLSQKDTFEKWLKNNSYKYTSKTKNGYYYVTVEYTNDTKKSTLVNYLKNKGFEYGYGTSNNSSFTTRNGKAYLVANGDLWYADGDEIEKVDTIYSPEYLLFTANGGISYINGDKRGMLIPDVEDPTDTEKIATSVKSITTNSSGYAISFKLTQNKTTKIESDYDLDNQEVTVYVVKNNTLYSLSKKNKLEKLKSLKSISNNSSYLGNKSNIGFSQWGDLVLINSSGVCFFNEDIDDPDGIELLKDQDGFSVEAKYFTVNNGIIKNLTLSNGSTVMLEDD